MFNFTNANPQTAISFEINIKSIYSYHSIFYPLILTSTLTPPSLYWLKFSYSNTNTLGNMKVMNTFKYRNQRILK